MECLFTEQEGIAQSEMESPGRAVARNMPRCLEAVKLGCSVALAPRPTTFRLSTTYRQSHPQHGLQKGREDRPGPPIQFSQEYLVFYPLRSLHIGKFASPIKHSLVDGIELFMLPAC
ncbi:MAG: hypothetical protein CMI15_06790 [Opitutaceae bacterium]|nr:hypothetical protein [Opitutaceae bacterium]